MRAFTVFSAFVVAVWNVLASPGSAPATLVARQAIPNVPNGCQAECAAAQSISTCGTDMGCICTDKIGRGILDCGNCGIKIQGNNADLDAYKNSLQQSLDSFVQSCATTGHNIGPYKVDGSTSSNPPTASSGTSTGTGAAPAATGAPNSAASVRLGGVFAGLAVIAVSLVL